MLDIKALCRDYNIPFIESGHHHTHQGWIQLHCPRCTNGTSGWHMGFSLTRGNFSCWRCGGLRTWDVLCQLLRSEDSARKALAKYRTEGQRPDSASEPKPRPKTLWTPRDLGALEPPHKKYLQRRRFDPERLEEEWDLQGTRHLSGEWNWRVVFPIYDQKEKNVAWCGRSIDDTVRPKYKMSDKEDMLDDPQRMLYGIHRVRDLVVIVEGPADVWRLGPGAVATLGMDWWTEQAFQLKEFPRRAVVFDPQPKAQYRARQLAEWLGMYDGETEIVTDLPCDPGSLPQDEADQLMKELSGKGLD